MRTLAGRLFSLCATLAFTTVPARIAAQARFDHTARIDGVLRQLGGARDLTRASNDQLSQLYENLSGRGQYLYDLYALDRDLVLELAAKRDSIGRSGGILSPSAMFFLARALHEVGRTREAATAYARAGSSAPARLRAEATSWAAVLSGKGGSSWHQQVTDWRQGKPVGSVSCAVGAPTACGVLQAMVSGDVPAILRVTKEALSRTTPEYVDTLAGKTGAFTIEYSDPVLYAILGAADYFIAGRVLQGRTALDGFRAIALLRAGRPRDALAAFASANAEAPTLSVFLGEAQFATGDRAAAEQSWKRVSGMAAVNMLADSRALLANDGALAMRQYDAESRKQLRSLQAPDSAGAYLARALLRTNHPEQALQVLRVVRPLSQTASLDRVQPLVPVLAAHATYRLGFIRGEQSRYVDALTELLPVAAFSGAAPVYRMLQQVSVPAASTGDVRGF